MRWRARGQTLTRGDSLWCFYTLFLRVALSPFQSACAVFTIRVYSLLFLFECTQNLCNMNEHRRQKALHDRSMDLEKKETGAQLGLQLQSPPHSQLAPMPPQQQQQQAAASPSHNPPQKTPAVSPAQLRHDTAAEPQGAAFMTPTRLVEVEPYVPVVELGALEKTPRPAAPHSPHAAPSTPGGTAAPQRMDTLHPPSFSHTPPARHHAAPSASVSDAHKRNTSTSLADLASMHQSSGPNTGAMLNSNGQRHSHSPKLSPDSGAPPPRGSSDMMMPDSIDASHLGGDESLAVARPHWLAQRQSGTAGQVIGDTPFLPVNRRLPELNPPAAAAAAASSVPLLGAATAASSSSPPQGNKISPPIPPNNLFKGTTAAGAGPASSRGSGGGPSVRNTPKIAPATEPEEAPPSPRPVLRFHLDEPPRAATESPVAANPSADERRAALLAAAESNGPNGSRTVTGNGVVVVVGGSRSKPTKTGAVGDATAVVAAAAALSSPSHAESGGGNGNGNGNGKAGLTRRSYLLPNWFVLHRHYIKPRFQLRWILLWNAFISLGVVVLLLAQSHSDSHLWYNRDALNNLQCNALHVAALQFVWLLVAAHCAFTSLGLWRLSRNFPMDGFEVKRELAGLVVLAIVAVTIHWALPDSLAAQLTEVDPQELNVYGSLAAAFADESTLGRFVGTEGSKLVFYRAASDSSFAVDLLFQILLPTVLVLWMTESVIHRIVPADATTDLLSSSETVSGLDELLSTKHGFASFFNFLKTEFTMQNLLYWRACKNFQSAIEDHRTLFLESQTRGGGVMVNHLAHQLDQMAGNVAHGGQGMPYAHAMTGHAAAFFQFSAQNALRPGGGAAAGGMHGPGGAGTHGAFPTGIGLNYQIAGAAGVMSALSGAGGSSGEGGGGGGSSHGENHHAMLSEVNSGVGGRHTQGLQTRLSPRNSVLSLSVNNVGLNVHKTNAYPHPSLLKQQYSMQVHLPHQQGQPPATRMGAGGRFDHQSTHAHAQQLPGHPAHSGGHRHNLSGLPPGAISPSHTSMGGGGGGAYAAYGHTQHHAGGGFGLGMQIRSRQTAAQQEGSMLSLGGAVLQVGSLVGPRGGGGGGFGAHGGGAGAWPNPAQGPTVSMLLGGGGGGFNPTDAPNAEIARAEAANPALRASRLQKQALAQAVEHTRLHAMKLLEKARSIYDRFVRDGAPYEVTCVDPSVRQNIVEFMSLLNAGFKSPVDQVADIGKIFTDSQDFVYTLMQTDAFPRYLNSQYFRDFNNNARARAALAQVRQQRGALARREEHAAMSARNNLPSFPRAASVPDPALTAGPRHGIGFGRVASPAPGGGSNTPTNGLQQQYHRQGPNPHRMTAPQPANAYLLRAHGGNSGGGGSGGGGSGGGAGVGGGGGGGRFEQGFSATGGSAGGLMASAGGSPVLSGMRSANSVGRAADLDELISLSPRSLRAPSPNPGLTHSPAPPAVPTPVQPSRLLLAEMVAMRNSSKSPNSYRDTPQGRLEVVLPMHMMMRGGSMQLAHDPAAMNHVAVDFDSGSPDAAHMNGGGMFNEFDQSCTPPAPSLPHDHPLPIASPTLAMLPPSAIASSTSGGAHASGAGAGATAMAQMQAQSLIQSALADEPASTDIDPPSIEAQLASQRQQSSSQLLSTSSSAAGLQPLMRQTSHPTAAFLQGSSGMHMMDRDRDGAGRGASSTVMDSATRSYSHVEIASRRRGGNNPHPLQRNGTMQSHDQLGGDLEQSQDGRGSLSISRRSSDRPLALLDNLRGTPLRSMQTGGSGMNVESSPSPAPRRFELNGNNGTKATLSTESLHEME